MYYFIILAVICINSSYVVELFNMLYVYLDYINTLEVSIIMLVPNVLWYSIKLNHFLLSELNYNTIASNDKKNSWLIIYFYISNKFILLYNNYRSIFSIVIGVYNMLNAILLIYNIFTLNLYSTVILGFISFILSSISIISYTYILWENIKNIYEFTYL